MAYDRALADRIREALAAERDVTERAMFGGLAFLLRGHLTVAANNAGGLMVRIDPTTMDDLLASTAAEPVEMRGRSMKGWLAIDAADLETDAELHRWVELATRFTAALPPKQ